MNDEPFETRLQAAWQQLQQSPDQFTRNARRLLMRSGATLFVATSFYHLLCVCIGMLLGLRVWNGIDEFPANLYPYVIFLTVLPSVFMHNPFKRLWQSPIRIELNDKCHPKLFAELSHLNQQRPIGGLPRVFLTPHNNAAVILMPRFIFFGWHKPVLEIGLETLLVLSPDQIRGVLAHEWGHFYNPREKLLARQIIITNYLKVLVQWSSKLRCQMLANGLQRLISRLTANYAALRHANEYAADRFAVELVGKTNATQGLIGVAAFGAWLDINYWTPLYSMSRYLPDPEISPFRCLYDYCLTYRFAATELMATVQADLRKVAWIGDSHPSLGERLTAMGLTSEWKLPTGPCAAECWFDTELPAILDNMDKQWRKHYASGWRKLHCSHLEQSAMANLIQPARGN